MHSKYENSAKNVLKEEFKINKNFKTHTPIYIFDITPTYFRQNHTSQKYYCI